MALYDCYFLSFNCVPHFDILFYSTNILEQIYYYSVYKDQNTINKIICLTFKIFMVFVRITVHINLPIFKTFFIFLFCIFQMFWLFFLEGLHTFLAVKYFLRYFNVRPSQALVFDRLTSRGSYLWLNIRIHDSADGLFCSSGP